MESILQCYHMHPLSNANFRPTNWWCNICRVDYIKGAIDRYRCDKCNFDVCKNCLLKTDTIYLPRFHSHNLYDSTRRGTNWTCNICRKEFSLTHQTKRYRCNLCDFDVCYECLKY